jgi:hypothetical protein
MSYPNKEDTMKALIAAIIIASASPVAIAAEDGSTNLSNASALVAGGSVLVTAGSLSVVAASGAAVIGSVQVVGESTLVVLESAVNSSTATIRLSGEAARGFALAAGTTVSVAVHASGHMLIAAGKVVAFIPNELGKALLCHERIR